MPNFSSRDLNLFSREMYDTQIITRRYQVSDASALASIYYHTIHNTNIRDYSIEQVNAWAPTSSLELDGWKKKWEKLPPIVAVSNDIIVGFTEFEPNGHIDCFYVHHEYQDKGVGSVLMAEIEANAKEKKILRVYAEVSITAKPFFEKKGFQVVKEQSVNIRGCQLTNFMMEKMIDGVIVKLTWSSKCTHSVKQLFSFFVLPLQICLD